MRQGHGDGLADESGPVEEFCEVRLLIIMQRQAPQYCMPSFRFSRSTSLAAWISEPRSARHHQVMSCPPGKACRFYDRTRG